MKTPLFDKTGKEIKQVELPKDIFDIEWNPDLVSDVVNALISNVKSHTAHSKDRAEVRGGGKKPYRQKGTGRARHGSRRSPIWRAGGITFGPRSDRNYNKKISKKMRSKALSVVLSQKARDGEIFFIDSLKTGEAKTKQASSVFDSIAKNKDFTDLKTKNKNAALVTIVSRDESILKSFRNISNVQIDLLSNINILDVLRSKYLIMESPEESFEILSKRTSLNK